MWSRSELKGRAKATLKNCYWKAVLVSLILGIVAGGSSGGSASQNTATTRKTVDGIMHNGGMEYLMTIMIAMFSIIAVLGIIGLALGIFLFKPLEVNARRFFIISRVQQADLSELGFCFKNSYMNVVKVQFLRGIFIFLWSLLLVVPGIIKAYEYRMIPYILAENPGLDSKEVFQISRDMMYGEKWNAFVLDLSFILWIMLGGITCGIASIFYVSPYINLTDAELYDTLKNKLFSGNIGGNPQNTANHYEQNGYNGQ